MISLRVPVVGLLLLGSLALSACASSSSSTSSSSSSAVAATSASAGAAASAGPATQAPAASGDTVTYLGVSVTGASTLTAGPTVTSKATAAATALAVEDLVVGTGAAATPTSSVEVQYTGVLYQDGTKFDSSWDHGGQAVPFSLTGVVPGFTQGIGGTTGVEPMKVGGRRLMIFPASLGYGNRASGPVPAGASLVFVVDLTKVS